MMIWTRQAGTWDAETRQAGVLAEERALRERIRTSLTDWAVYALPEGQVPALHHRLMIAELERVAAGGCDRLMLLLPPGSAKSTYASLLFPPWFLSRQMGHVIAVSHTAGLAQAFGRGVRGLVDEHGVRLGLRLSRADRSAGRFSVIGLSGSVAGRGRRGGYFAAGVQGAISGRRADLVIIDDPVRGQAEAESAVMRERLWDWYRSELVTRLRPGGRVVVVMTRWHPDDLGGRLLAGDGEAGGGWRVVRLPALAEAGDMLGRAEGEALWPEWEGKAALERKRLTMGDRSFAALFQQSPRVGGGRLFEVGRLSLDEGRLLGAGARAWDLAASAEGDWTVGVLLIRGAEGRFQVADVVRFRGEPHAVVQAVLDTAALDGRGVVVCLPQDPGQAGRMQVQYLTGRLAGWRVVSSPESGAKVTRAMPVASQVNGGGMGMFRGNWNRAFVEELRDFPGGAKDDQVDGLSRAFGVLTAGGVGARGARLDWGAR